MQWTIFPLITWKNPSGRVTSQHREQKSQVLKAQKGEQYRKEPWVYRYESQDHGSADMTKVDRGKNQDTVQNGRVTRKKQNERYRKNIYPLKDSPMVRIEVVT